MEKIENYFTAAHQSAERGMNDERNPETRFEDAMAAWRNAVVSIRDTYRRTGSKLTPDDLECVWSQLDKLGKRFAGEDWLSKKMRIEEHVARLLLLDLNLGPVSFRGPRELHGVGRECHSELERKPPGLSIQQNIFLTGKGKRTEDNTLDHVARQIAEEDGCGGVYLLAGVRGSGKSTALNRIEWFCHHWLQGKPHPLVLRFDLGVQFDRDRFLINLMTELCRRVIEHCKQAPLASPVPLRHIWHFLGHLGRWCEANSRWAILLSFLIASFLTVEFLQQPSSTTAPQLTTFANLKFWSEELKTNAGVAPTTALTNLASIPGQTNLAPVPGQTNFAPITELTNFLARADSLRRINLRQLYELHNLAEFSRLSGLSNIAVLVTNTPNPSYVPLAGPELASLSRFSSLTNLAPLVQHPFERWVNAQPHAATALVMLLGVMVLGLAYSIARIVRARSKRALERRTRDWILGLLLAGVAMAAFVIISGIRWPNLSAWPLQLWITLVLSLSACQFLLPLWWEHYVRCRSRLDVFRRRDDSKNPELPYVSQFTSAVSVLLPKTTPEEDFREMDTPFLQQAVKDLLRETSHALERVVILIDDVDVLPSDAFHSLLRLLRPLSKVPDLRCVVCVPIFMYDALSASKMGDLHSTVREVHVLGDPELFEGPKKNFAPSDGMKNKDVLRESLVSLLRSRIILPIDWSRGANPPTAGEPEFLKDLIERWTPNDEKHWGRVQRQLEQNGASRREIIRETDQLLRGATHWPFEDYDSHEEARRKDRLEDSKTDYHLGEVSLVCDPEQRVRWFDAREKLDGNGETPKGKASASFPARSGPKQK